MHCKGAALPEARQVQLFHESRMSYMSQKNHNPQKKVRRKMRLTFFVVKPKLTI